MHAGHILEENELAAGAVETFHRWAVKMERDRWVSTAIKALRAPLGTALLAMDAPVRRTWRITHDIAAQDDKSIAKEAHPARAAGADLVETAEKFVRQLSTAATLETP
jgi:hypothetical protein